jgi:DNA-binding transcriptional MerR regulator
VAGGSVTRAQALTYARKVTGDGDRGGLLQIGEVAGRVGLSLRTVRYYEEVGLFAPSARSPGGFRLYSESDVQRLRVLKGMKPFGLTLEEIRELMGLLDAAEGAGPDDAGALAEGLARYADRADERIAKIEGHLSEVRRLRASIAAHRDRLGLPGAAPGA